MYRAGFVEEGLISNAGPPSSSSAPARSADPAPTGGESVIDEQVHRDGGTTIVERTLHSDLSGIPGEFGALGFPERTIVLG